MVNWGQIFLLQLGKKTSSSLFLNMFLSPEVS